ncbi:MAG TPA: ankyrin repeat domain-containing protein [Candidatus Babeliales bacterium]|nr:ankyrin repeat domain-containing protein [Candidatus Babeliales bacterium]
MIYKRLVFSVAQIIVCGLLFFGGSLLSEDDLGVSSENAGSSTGREVVIANQVASEVPAQERASDEFLFNPAATIKELEKKMIDAPGLVNKKNQFGVTALMGAARDGNLDKVELFLRYNADVNVVSSDHIWTDMTIDKGGNVALHYALYYGNNPHVYRIVEALLRKGADPEKRNNMQEMPIHYLREVQNMEVKRMLLRLLVDEYEVDINARGYNGDTILHQTVARNDLPFAGVLNEFRGKLQFGIKNYAQLTPLEYAQSMSRDGVASALIGLASPGGLKQEDGNYMVNAPEENKVGAPDGLNM